MKCMSEVCRPLCRRMCSLPCIGRFRDWKIAGLCVMHMRLNMIASTQDNCTRRWNLRMLRAFSAGQFNGSSGYEEAASQGILAGINAGLKCQGREPMIIDRSEGYLGVLVDDLVTKENTEPYG